MWIWSAVVVEFYFNFKEAATNVVVVVVAVFWMSGGKVFNRVKFCLVLS